MSNKKKHGKKEQQPQDLAVVQKKGNLVGMPGVDLDTIIRPTEYDLFSTPQEKALCRILIDEKERQATFLGEKSRLLELNFQKMLQRLRDNTLLVCKHCGGPINFFDPSINALSGCCSEKCEDEWQARIQSQLEMVEPRIKEILASIDAINRAHKESLAGGPAKNMGNHAAESNEGLDHADKIRMQKLKKELEQCEEAVRMIHEGTYGKCQECEEDIPLKRLKAVPDAIHCVECKTEMERLEKMAIKK